jgi:hypothetical protein
VKLKPQLATFLFFVYGSLIQLLFLRLAVLFSYPKGDPGRPFVDSYLVNVGVCLFGGVFTSLVMFRATRKLAKVEKRPNAAQLLLRCGLYGLLATFLTFQAFFITTAFYLASTALQLEGGVMFLPVAFLMALLEIETYGMISVIGLSPIAFVFGLGLGTLELRLLPRPLPFAP